MNRNKHSVIMQGVILAAAIALLLLAFIPILLMLLLSVKSNAQIYTDFWAVPWPFQWSNYDIAISLLIQYVQFPIRRSCCYIGYCFSGLS